MASQLFSLLNIATTNGAGELKKMLAGKIGLSPQDQKLIFKEKERDSKAFLDVVGVKDGSKIVLIEDELSKERRILESRRNAKMDRASKDIAAIRLEVDKLAKQVYTNFKENITQMWNQSSFLITYDI